MIRTGGGRVSREAGREYRPRSTVPLVLILANWRLEGKGVSEAHIRGHLPPPALVFCLQEGQSSPGSEGRAASSPPQVLCPDPLTLQLTYPELAEVGVGVVVGLVVGVQQGGDDALLLLRQLRPQAVLQGLLLLPLEDHLPFPLHLFISQDDCGGAGGGVRRAGPAVPPRNVPPGVEAPDGRGCALTLGAHQAILPRGPKAHDTDGRVGAVC